MSGQSWRQIYIWCSGQPASDTIRTCMFLLLPDVSVLLPVSIQLPEICDSFLDEVVDVFLNETKNYSWYPDKILVTWSINLWQKVELVVPGKAPNHLEQIPTNFTFTVLSLQLVFQLHLMWTLLSGTWSRTWSCKTKYRKSQT